MTKPIFVLLFLTSFNLAAQERKEPLFSGNPIFPGWYADPEGTIFGDSYWVFPTFSDESGNLEPTLQLSDYQKKIRNNTINPQYLKQTFLDAFSSKDLVHWEKHPHVLDVKDISWAGYAIWAPSITKKGGKYYLFFGANDIQNNQQPGGIGIAVANSPEGPYKDLLGKPLVSQFYNDAQPIDQFAFRDTDGQYYLIYGGWRHCNIGKLKEDFTGLIPFPDGTLFKSITPEK